MQTPRLNNPLESLTTLGVGRHRAGNGANQETCATMHLANQVPCLMEELLRDALYCAFASPTPGECAHADAAQL